MTEPMKYTLDRVEDGFYVFLLRSDESEELLIPKSSVSVVLSEGDIVHIRKTDNRYDIEPLKDETIEMKSKVTDLLEKLSNKQ
ncbi:DUF3006 family protein [Sporosarcina sp. 179-K 3D1 HS]|uniref:DUF3006 family protein n=1 Tax=Sporosarcina sp. 179-K 3D1 HS TaxID=3232169 RepID=UPI0039A149AE